MRRRALTAVVVAAATIGGALVSATPAAAQPPDAVSDSMAPEEDVVYRHPVEGPVVDGFRPPAEPWLPGNRGLEYATFPGEAVTAAADGMVIFAGQVAGTLHVTILHDDGLRTSYSFLASVDVSEGRRLMAGAVVGRAARRVHFGVRDPTGSYLDPGNIIGRQPVLRAQLASHDDEAVATAAAAARRREERSTLSRLVGAAGATGGWVGDRVADGMDVSIEAGRMMVERYIWTVARPIVAIQAWADLGVALTSAVLSPPDCTPVSIRPSPPEGQRVAVLVPGLNAPSDGGPITELDMAALGFAPPDVIRFSYNGGRIPDPDTVGENWFDPLPATANSPEATRRSVADSSIHLAALLDDVRRLRPGATIEIYGFSIGGMVAVSAIGQMTAWEVPASVLLVTIASPHRGLTPARTLERIGAIPGLAGLDGFMGIPVGSPIVADLASGTRASLPPDVPMLSIGSIGDPLVPAVRTVFEGAETVIVGSGGLFEHDGLVSEEGTSREISLFLAGRPPGCRSLIHRVGAAVVPRLIAGAHDMVSVAGPVDGLLAG
ncbi:MAG: M23 family metallopeptidase [Actinobacteria bacterium]|jgi:hypothetical protein|nr:M23 family metallopeptidase [Actinomycetota bacterium]MBT3686764.1 M23 family metallopeptidase [Actinomycetota bacterium]MBT4037612.1 M23 family metallopeptidase [Actinomycetota bacterium]MBT4279537.1 M23 family metallopeptidase [Actinomycetota bacterium]MBT4343517.1 M23 family metallopeptidase [Actinomycetota bacterium]